MPEDRKRAGLILDMPIVENITLASLLAYARMLLVNRGAEQAASPTAAGPPVDQGAGRPDAGRYAVGRQPAEGGAGQVAVDAAAAW